MRTFGRLLALGAICGGALGLAAVPAAAFTISVGGSNPTLPLPLPVTVTAGVDDGGLHTDVQAPAATDISVNAGLSGVSAKATAANHPLVDANIATPTVPTIPVGGGGVLPVSQLPPVLTPAPSSAPADASSPVASDQPVAGRAPNASARVATAPRPNTNTVTGAAPLAERDLRTATPAGDRTPDVSGEIASHPNSGLLDAMTGSGARIALWIALAGAVLALRLFVGSATAKATRAG